MKIGIMQPYLFPYIGYFQLMNSVDRFILLDDVNYIKKGWINRNRILVNGADYLFTLPLEGTSQNKLICETKIADIDSWRFSFLKTIERAYRKALCFDTTYQLLQQILSSEEQLISRFIANSLSILIGYLGMHLHLIPTSINYGNKDLKGQDRLQDICIRENATHYHNAIGGVEMYSRDIFLSKGITLQFVKPTLTKYLQFSNAFIPGLSIIDVLMFNPKNNIQAMLSEYELV